MNLVIPFTKDIKFKSNIAEILSVSLEHDFTANSEEILGNFTISGEYKTHEVSVNKENFEFVLPFSVSLASKIDTNSVDFEVEDFTYEIKDNETMRVNIEYKINASEIEEEPLFKTIEEPSLDKLLDEIDNRVEDFKNTLEDENLEETKEIKKENNEEREEVDILEQSSSNVDNDAKNVILGAKIEDDTYVTYQVFEYLETDTIESICLKYNTTEAILSEYNDLKNISVHDKIIIPLNYE